MPGCKRIVSWRVAVCTASLCASACGLDILNRLPQPTPYASLLADTILLGGIAALVGCAWSSPWGTSAAHRTVSEKVEPLPTLQSAPRVGDL
jgi:hypothetical protein